MTGFVAIAALIIGIVMILAAFAFDNVIILVIGVVVFIAGIACVLIAAGTITVDGWPLDLHQVTSTGTVPVDGLEES